MAEISELRALLIEHIADDDVVFILDVSDTAAGAEGTYKRVGSWGSVRSQFDAGRDEVLRALRNIKPALACDGWPERRAAIERIDAVLAGAAPAPEDPQ